MKQEALFNFKQKELEKEYFGLLDEGLTEEQVEKKLKSKINSQYKLMTKNSLKSFLRFIIQ